MKLLSLIAVLAVSTFANASGPCAIHLEVPEVEAIESVEVFKGLLLYGFDNQSISLGELNILANSPGPKIPSIESKNLTQVGALHRALNEHVQIFHANPKLWEILKQKLSKSLKEKHTMLEHQGLAQTDTQIIPDISVKRINGLDGSLPNRIQGVMTQKSLLLILDEGILTDNFTVTHSQGGTIFDWRGANRLTPKSKSYSEKPTLIRHGNEVLLVFSSHFVGVMSEQSKLEIIRIDPYGKILGHELINLEKLERVEFATLDRNNELVVVTSLAKKPWLRPGFLKLSLRRASTQFKSEQVRIYPERLPHGFVYRHFNGRFKIRAVSDNVLSVRIRNLDKETLALLDITTGQIFFSHTELRGSYILELGTLGSTDPKAVYFKSTLKESWRPLDEIYIYQRIDLETKTLGGLKGGKHPDWKSLDENKSLDLTGPDGNKWTFNVEKNFNSDRMDLSLGNELTKDRITFSESPISRKSDLSISSFIDEENGNLPKVLITNHSVRMFYIVDLFKGGSSK